MEGSKWKSRAGYMFSDASFSTQTAINYNKFREYKGSGAVILHDKLAETLAIIGFQQKSILNISTGYHHFNPTKKAQLTDLQIFEKHNVVSEG
jgi:hypothetical protein